MNRIPLLRAVLAFAEGLKFRQLFFLVAYSFSSICWYRTSYRWRMSCCWDC
jgi:hypothetical protein